MIKNTYFWTLFLPGYQDHFNLWVLQEKQSFQLEIFYGAFFSSPTLKSQYHLSDNIEDRSNKEAFLSYLSDLLERGEVEMRVCDETYELKYEDEQEVLYSTCLATYNYTYTNYQEGIDMLRNKWFSFTNERYKRSWEFTGVLFILPGGEYLY